MKTNNSLIIFSSNGRTRMIPLRFTTHAKSMLQLAAMVFLAGASIICYNHVTLGRLKDSHTQTIRSLALEKRFMNQRLQLLEEFEEKISFFLGGALTDGKSTAVAGNYFKAMGGGREEQEFGEPTGIEVLSEEPDMVIPLISQQSARDAGVRALLLKNSLENLARLAVKEKNRLDYTPSIIPVKGYITSRFGWRISPFTGNRHFHRGIDLVNELGTPIKATAKGRVILAGREQFWGNTVFIEHRDGIISKYGHLDSISLSTGDQVERGDVIGTLGMSGRSTGPHLHYQIEIREKAVDPMQFVIKDLDF